MKTLPLSFVIFCLSIFNSICQFPRVPNARFMFVKDNEVLEPLNCFNISCGDSLNTSNDTSLIVWELKSYFILLTDSNSECNYQGNPLPYIQKISHFAKINYFGIAFLDYGSEYYKFNFIIVSKWVLLNNITTGLVDLKEWIRSYPRVSLKFSFVNYDERNEAFDCTERHYAINLKSLTIEEVNRKLFVND